MRAVCIYLSVITAALLDTACAKEVPVGAAAGGTATSGTTSPTAPAAPAGAVEKVEGKVVARRAARGRLRARARLRRTRRHSTRAILRRQPIPRRAP